LLYDAYWLHQASDVITIFEALETTARMALAIAFYSLLGFSQLQGLETTYMDGLHAF
jgi:hypothetical protein